MRIAKKVIIASVVFIVITIAVSFAYMKYEEHQNISDQSIALECLNSRDDIAKKYDLDEIYETAFFLIESSPESRSTENYYRIGYQLITDLDYDITEDNIDIDDYHFWSDPYAIMRTNKYIHLFNWVSAEKYYYKKAQDKLQIHEELIDEVAEGRQEYDPAFIPLYSFNRETLEVTKWNTAKSLSSSDKFSCKEIEPSILHNRVKKTQDKATSGEKKI